MKKFTYLIATIFAFALNSCSDQEEIEIKYQVDVTVDPSSVISAFHGYYNKGITYGLNMDDDSQLLITSLIYDESGLLVEKKEKLVNDYSSSLVFPLLMKDGEQYTVVAISYSIDQKNNVNSYIIENEDRLEKLTITSEYMNGESYYSNWSMLGISSKVISANDKVSTIYIQPASAQVVLLYTDIHAFNEAGVDQHWIAYKNNVRAKFEGQTLTYGSNSATNSGYIHRLDVTGDDSSGIFVIINLLPTSEMDIWAGFSEGGKDYSYSSFLDYAGLDPSKGEAQLTMEAGQEYSFQINCGSCTINVGSRTKSMATSMVILDNHKQKKMYPQNYRTQIVSPQQSASVLKLLNHLK